jgi:putative Mn2+ efflux pump MntP
MTSLLIGSFLISLLHAIIPNHWLPVLAIGRKEGWSLAETTRITFISGLAHVLSTVIIGLLLALIGNQLAGYIEDFSRIIGSAILILMGLYFIRQHYTHHHFHVNEKQLNTKSKKALLISLIIAMFLSPCMEIEAYFLVAGNNGWRQFIIIALLYSTISITGMLIWVRIAYKGMLRLNWHKLEHNAGIITGCILIATGILSFFIR